MLMHAPIATLHDRFLQIHFDPREKFDYLGTKVIEEKRTKEKKR